MKKERSLQAKVLAWLRAHGGEWENRAPGYFGSSGTPDITGIYLGRHVEIELKHPREHGPKADDTRWPAQQKRLKRVFENGGFALATNSFEVVTAFFADIDAHSIGNVSGSYPIYWERFV